MTLKLSSLLTRAPATVAKVMAAAERFRELGAQVEDVSIPEHLTAIDAWTAIVLDG